MREQVTFSSSCLSCLVRASLEHIVCCGATTVQIHLPSLSWAELYTCHDSSGLAGSTCRKQLKMPTSIKPLCTGNIEWLRFLYNSGWFPSSILQRFYQQPCRAILVAGPQSKVSSLKDNSVWLYSKPSGGRILISSYNIHSPQSTIHTIRIPFGKCM